MNPLKLEKICGVPAPRIDDDDVQIPSIGISLTGTIGLCTIIAWFHLVHGTAGS